MARKPAEKAPKVSREKAATAPKKSAKVLVSHIDVFVNNGLEAHRVEHSTIEAFVEEIGELLKKDQEHLYLQYIVDAKGYDIKYHRYDFTDEQILADLRNWLRQGLAIVEA